MADNLVDSLQKKLKNKTGGPAMLFPLQQTCVRRVSDPKVGPVEPTPIDRSFEYQQLIGTTVFPMTTARAVDGLARQVSSCGEHQHYYTSYYGHTSTNTGCRNNKGNLNRDHLKQAVALKNPLFGSLGISLPPPPSLKYTSAVNNESLEATLANVIGPSEVECCGQLTEDGYDDDDMSSINTGVFTAGSFIENDEVMVDSKEVFQSASTPAKYPKVPVAAATSSSMAVSQELTACKSLLMFTMKKSLKTQEDLQDWDQRNGLPRSHSCTMTNTSRSRRQIIEGRILPKWNGDPLIGTAKSNKVPVNKTASIDKTSTKKTSGRKRKRKT